MVEKIIRKYICELKIEDIHDFALKNDIVLTNEEAKIIYDYIKKDWEIIAFGDEKIVLNEAKKVLEEKTYNKLTELISFYKEKYKRYL